MKILVIFLAFVTASISYAESTGGVVGKTYFGGNLRGVVVPIGGEQTVSPWVVGVTVGSYLNEFAAIEGSFDIGVVTDTDYIADPDIEYGISNMFMGGIRLGSYESQKILV